MTAIPVTIAESRAGRIAVIVKGYPRLSETFIAQELLALEQRGFALEIWSLRHPTDDKRHAIHGQIQAPVRYLPEYLHREPVRVLRAWWRARRLSGYPEARRRFIADLRRDRSRNRLRRFAQALVLASELPPSVRALYVHFVHTPGSVTRYAATLLQQPWAASAHARDIWTSAEWDLRDKLTDLRWLVTCTASNVDYLRSLADDPDRVHRLYHGIDRQRVPLLVGDPLPASSDVIRLLAVGRAVDKKGFDVMLNALAQLTRPWRLTHIGGGSGRSALQAQAASLGIGDRIVWQGSQRFDAVLEAYRSHDLMLMPSRIDTDGDRDGIPNVLMEAQAQRLAVIASRLSGIPELVIDGETGILVEPGDASALTTAIDRLADDPALRRRLAQAGQRRVSEHFLLEQNIDRLVHLLDDLRLAWRKP
ncbi:glycosyltransferase family 4 protein [Gammaproteobacteria bacterium]|nr:glycosyltransferase family 4 protein [Gammaproteobacteria bacterium]